MALIEDPAKVYYPGNIMYAADIDARIQYLNNQDEREELTEDERDELTALGDFRDLAMDKWGTEAWQRDLSLVAEGYWAEYAATRAKDIYGEATETGYWNADLWAEDLQTEYEAITYDGTDYLSDGT